MSSFSNPYDERSTRFVARLRTAGPISDNSRSKSSSPNAKKKPFLDTQNYCCVPNFRNNSIYITDSPFSGKLLNNQAISKEDSKNKFILTDNPDIYQLDKVYGEATKQKEFYTENAKPLLHHMLGGVNSLVLTYGPQGSGKSYTMRGSGDEIGIVPRFAKDLIAATEGTNFGVSISVLQIYKDWIFDLLRDENERLETNETEDSMIKECRLKDFGQFINILGDAINKREINKTASKIMKKYHLVIRLKLRDQNDRTRKIFSCVDFIETAESSFLTNQENFSEDEIDWLGSSFGALNELLIKTFCRGVKLSPVSNALNNYIGQSLSSKSKLLFITCLLPGPKDRNHDRDALEFSSKLRNSIVNKSDKKFTKNASFSTPEKGGLTERHRGADSFSSGSIDARIRSMKTKLKGAYDMIDRGQDVTEWLDEKENEIAELHKDISLISSGEGINKRLQDAIALKKEFQKLRERNRVSKFPKSGSNSFQIQSREIPAKLNFSLNIPPKDSSGHRIEEDRPLKPLKSSRESHNPVINSDRPSHSRSSSYHLKKEQLSEIPENSRKTKQRVEVPKFEPYKELTRIQQESKLLKSESSKNPNFQLTPERADVSPRILSARGSRDVGSSNRQAKKPPARKDSHQTHSNKNMNYVSAKEYYNYSSTASDEHDIASSKEFQRSSYRNKTPKKIELFDEDEEIIRTRKIENLTRDELIIRYERLFQKATEVQDILSSFSETNKELKDRMEFYEKEKKLILEENDNLKMNVNQLTEDIALRDHENRQNTVEIQNKLLKAEQERDYLKLRNEEVSKQLEFYKDRLRDPQDGSKSISSELESVEKLLSSRDRKIRELEENKYKAEASMTQMKTEFEAMKKKYNTLQNENKDLKNMVHSLESKEENSNDVVKSLKGQLNDTQNALQDKSQSLENERQKLQDYKNKIKELESINSELKHDNSRLVVEIRNKDRLEQKFLNSQEDLKMLKENNIKLQDEILRMSKTVTHLEEEIMEKHYQVEELRTQLTKLSDSEKKIEKYMQKNRKLNDSQEELRDANGELRTQLKKVEAKNRELERQIELAKTDKQMIFHDRDALETKVKLMRNEINELKYELEKAHDYIGELNGQLNETERAKGEYRDQLKQYEKEKHKEKMKDDYRVSDEKQGRSKGRDTITLIEQYGMEGSGAKTHRSRNYDL